MLNKISSFNSFSLTASNKDNNSQDTESSQSISYYQLFRFATQWQKCIIIISCFFAMLGAIGIPCIIVLYAEYATLLVDRVREKGRSTDTFLLQLFGGGRSLTDASTEENRAAILEDSIAYGYGSLVVMGVQFVSTSVAVIAMNWSALQQVNSIRKLFFKSSLRQEIGWFDLNSNESVAVRITENLEKIKEGIGEKLVMFIYLMTNFTICIVIAFISGWKLTLVLLSFSPLLVASAAFISFVQAKLTDHELKAYASAGSIVEEVLGAIRTVYAFSGQQLETDRYRDRLGLAERRAIRKGLYTGVGGGVMWLVSYSAYALAFWYGMRLILEDKDKDGQGYTAAVMITVLFTVLTASESFGQTLPYFETFNGARGAAGNVFSVIERPSKIDSLLDTGLKPKTLKGDIDFDNVHFCYPSRKGVPALNGLSIRIKSGQRVALVGSSGCGKSTVVQLIQRFYDPETGAIKIDDNKLTSLNVATLRSNIGLVGQEPVLFDTTIAENIRYGKPDATFEEVVEAAKTANCHEFIAKLPDGYETRVGQRGSQFSGGQKQRIAIARAIIRNPSILLLDEATSALDTNSEKKVQAALDRVSEGRTTVVVSHRLSTIVNADKIYYMERGQVVEEGTHAELLEAKGKYWELVMAQSDKHAVSSDRKASIQQEEADDDVVERTEDETKNLEVSKSDEKYPVPLFRLLKLNSPEGGYLALGFMCATIIGASFPIFGILFGSVYALLGEDNEDFIKSQTNFYSILFIILGVTVGLAMFFQVYTLNVAGARLTKRLRVLTMSSMLRQEIAWHDEPQNSVGQLAGRLSGDCADVQNALGTRLGYIFQAISIVFIGVGLALFYSWRLTVVSIWAIPVSLSIVVFESYYSSNSSKNEKQAVEEASKIAVEAVTNVRTIVSLGQEVHVIARYDVAIDDATRHCQTKIRFRGPIFALTQVIPVLGYTMSLCYGGYLVSRFQMEFDDVIKVSEALLFGVWMLGQALIYAPNVNSAITSAGRILQLIDRKPVINDPLLNDFNKNWHSDGNVIYSNVRFKYPSRKTTVLDGLNFNVPKGKSVALVGPSGSGKSTTVQLLLRYYDFEGVIKLDDWTTQELPINVIRRELGMVSQEPVLFDRTIAANIAYGATDREVPMAEIIDVAKQANIHEFIVALPQGYETPLGAQASQLSGGQKQRIAIARALVRNPKILLLDEATSALDNQSEKVVQAALEDAARGRTCITIAHRLTTIRNADLICVLESGKVVESGTHEQLMASQGSYARLYDMQQIN